MAGTDHPCSPIVKTSASHPTDPTIDMEQTVGGEPDGGGVLLFVLVDEECCYGGGQDRDSGDSDDHQDDSHDFTDLRLDLVVRTAPECAPFDIGAISPTNKPR